jgi:hypothetical protein
MIFYESDPSLNGALSTLHPALHQTVGNAYFPTDNGLALLAKLKQKPKGLFCASDASLKDQRGSHAWVISSGDVDDLSDPLLHIHGSGPVHGLSTYLSSSRGESQGITAIGIIVRLFME